MAPTLPETLFRSGGAIKDFSLRLLGVAMI
jgi:hypothetical protein